jgi:hypothetical protein
MMPRLLTILQLLLVLSGGLAAGALGVVDYQQQQRLQQLEPRLTADDVKAINKAIRALEHDQVKVGQPDIAAAAGVGHLVDVSVQAKDGDKDAVPVRLRAIFDDHDQLVSLAQVGQ